MAIDLLVGVRATPDDDGPRHVVADWFEQRGELDRARFIRLQLQRGALQQWDPDVVRLELQERALLRDFEANWRADLPELEGVRWGAFRRGFVDKLVFDDVGVLLEHGPECLAAAPISSLVIRWPSEERWPDLAAIAGIRELTVIGTLMQPEDMDWLANSELLSTVEVLNLVESQMDADGLARLLRSPHVAQLRALRMPHHSFGNEGLELLLKASLPALRELDLSIATKFEVGSGGPYQPTIDTSGLEALAAWPGLARLETLDLSGHQMALAGLRALLGSPRAAGLKILRLRSTSDWAPQNDEHELLAFADTVDGMRLCELDIDETPFGEAVARVLAGSRALAELERLSFNAFDLAGVFETLTTAPWFDSLRSLTAGGSTPEHLRAVVRRAPNQLHTLDLGSFHDWYLVEGSTKVPTILSEQLLPTMLALNLPRAAIGVEDLQALGSLTSLPNLLSLRVLATWKKFSEEAVAAFAESDFAIQLVSLSIGSDDINRLPPPEPIQVGEGAYIGPLRYS